MMGELKVRMPSTPPGLGQGTPAPAAPAAAPAAPAPVAAAPAPAPVSSPVTISHGTQVLIAGALAGLALLGVIFFTD
jgi:hypothetical protein